MFVISQVPQRYLYNKNLQKTKRIQIKSFDELEIKVFYTVVS